MPQPQSLAQQIADIEKQVDEGAPIGEVCRKTWVSVQAYTRWRRKYDRPGSSEIRRLRSLEEENRQLKKLVAELSWTKQLLQDSIRAKK